MATILNNAGGTTTLLDCRGLACPQPVMRCRDSLTEGATALETLNVARFLRGRASEVTWAGKPATSDGWRAQRRNEAGGPTGACAGRAAQQKTT